jgi:hypothetical protein
MRICNLRVESMRTMKAVGIISAVVFLIFLSTAVYAGEEITWSATTTTDKGDCIKWGDSNCVQTTTTTDKGECIKWGDPDCPKGDTTTTDKTPTTTDKTPTTTDKTPTTTSPPTTSPPTTIPEFPGGAASALPAVIALGGYLAIRYFKKE